MTRALCYGLALILFVGGITRCSSILFGAVHTLNQEAFQEGYQKGYEEAVKSFSTEAEK